MVLSFSPFSILLAKFIYKVVNSAVSVYISQIYS